MTKNEYLAFYLNDISDKYHHLPKLETAEPLSHILASSYHPDSIYEETVQNLANKFNMTDISMHKFMNVIKEDDLFIHIL
ncbi:hypothetical protein LNP18_06240 [Leuconostoc citreum]|uniref:hypothetical protein n=1 Tax=Leuconostoc citreum TaxID=33964 RepID=UPI00200A98D3|nr:hypothetical protein [Leuconostoc citreum]MCK8605702.1 hypothetical protein [Leuconostoc citreum]